MERRGPGPFVGDPETFIPPPPAAHVRGFSRAAIARDARKAARKMVELPTFPPCPTCGGAQYQLAGVDRCQHCLAATVPPGRRPRTGHAEAE